MDENSQLRMPLWLATRLPPFVLAFLVWVLIVWPFGPGGWADVLVQDVGAGLLAAVLVLLVMRDVTVVRGSRWLDLDRWGWFFGYVGVLIYYVVLANLDVVYRVLHPDMPIRPGIVRVKTCLKTPLGITVLANSITLTPGTLTVNATEDGVLYVHWIWVESEDDDAAAARISERFEWYIKQIFE